MLLCPSQTSFADWSPLLIASEASLELLNSKLDTAVVIERFRPNIVVSGCLPHSEVGVCEPPLFLRIQCTRLNLEQLSALCSRLAPCFGS